MPRGKGITKRQWIDAVEKCGGIVGDIAAELGLNRVSVSRKKANNVWLQLVFDRVLEQNKDVAESAIVEALASKDLKTSRWYLDRKAQDRGYGNKVKVDAHVNQTGQIHLYLPDDGRDRDKQGPNGS